MSIKWFLVLVAVAGISACAEKKDDRVNYLGQELPGLTAVLFAPGIISTDSFEHSAPAFSPDGSVVLWTVVDKSYHAYLLEMRYEDGKWSSPYSPSFADSTADDYYPCFSPDGEKLYFSSRRKLPTGYPGGEGIRVWEVSRKINSWGTPVPFDTTVSRDQNFAHSITNDGTIYFSSLSGGRTSMNIRYATKISNGYTQPGLLPYGINTTGYEDGPCISPDDSFLIFESQRPEGLEGSGDLYVSFKNKEGNWSIPVNMGPKINSSKTERFARLSPDGKYLFFGSNRNQSDKNWGFDIYWIDASVISELKPEETSANYFDKQPGGQIITALFNDDTANLYPLVEDWVTLHPGHLDATVLYSSVLRQRKQYIAAENLLSSKLHQWEGSSHLIMELALAKFAVGKDAEARKLLEGILEGDELRERFIYLSGSLLEMEKLTLSEEYFEKAMAIFPSSFPYYHRGVALAKLGEKDKAFEALEKAIQHGGYNSRKDYESDINLESLRSDPRWQQLLRRLQ